MEERYQLGRKLEELRGKKSLRVAAEETGLSHSYIRDVELGVNRATKAPIHPSPDTLRKLANCYRYSYEELMRLAGYYDEDTQGNENRAFRDFDNTTEEERDFLKAQLEIFRNLKKK